MYQEVPNLTPVRDITTYFHLVSMAMGERHRDTTLSREFRICMPLGNCPLSTFPLCPPSIRLCSTIR
jgi:hypothetical protein